MSNIGKSVIRVLPRKYSKGEVITIKTKLMHPQQNGRFKDEAGQYIPPHHITEFKAFYGEVEVFSLEASSSIAVNPFIDFSIKANKSAKLKVRWRDNKNATYENSEDINPD